MEFLARWLWCTGKQSCEKWSGDHISTYQSRKEKRNMGQVPRSITFHARLLHIGMTPIRPYKEGYTMGIDTPWAWTQSQESVFTALQHALTSSLVLILLYYNKPFTLITDTSNYAMGSILEQDDMLGWLHPVAFYSKSLQPAERHYKFMTKNSWLSFILSSISAITSKAMPTKQRYFQTTQISSTSPQNKHSHIAKRSGPYSSALLTILSSPSLAKLTSQMHCPGIQIIKQG